MRYFFAFLICAFSYTFSFAQQDSLHVYFSADDQNPPAGQLDVEVYVNDWVSLVGVQIFVKWDSTVLEVTQVPFINNTDLTGPSVILPFQNAVNPERGQAKYNFFDFSGPTLSDSTHIFTLRFDVVGGPCDETTLTIGDIGPNPSQKIEITGVDMDGNLVTGIGASVNESLFSIPGVNCDAVDPVGLNFPTISGNPGDNICVPLTVTNFDSIAAIDGSVNWNPNLIEYTGVQGLGIGSLMASDFSSTTPGTMIYTWADLTTNTPATLADGATLFEVCFDIIGTPGTSSTITLSDNPNPVSVSMAPADPSGSPIGLMVTIGSGSLNIVPPMGTSPVAFLLGNVTGSIGTNVCIPLTVNDFTDITAFSGSVNWDPSVIQYTGVQAIGISSMTAGDFMDSAGVLSYEWMDLAMPETLADGSTLFELCFDVIGAAGSSTSIDITDNPTTITLVQDGSAPGVPGFSVGSGGLSIPAPQVPDPIIFNFPTISANTGDNFCIPLTLDNFEDMVSLNGSVMWDQTVIQYTGTQSYGLTGFDASGINDGPASTGMLGFVWSDPTPTTPETLPDGGTLMEICFEVVGSGGSSSTITMSNDPTSITAGYQGSDPSQPVINIDTETNSGVISISGVSTGDEVGFTFPDLIGDPGSNVCVPLTVENFINISSVNGSVNWDPTILSFTNLGNNNLPGFVGANFNSSNADNGQATFLWSDGTAVTPLTLPDGEFLFEVCFDVIGADGTVSPISVTNDPTAISVAAADPNNPAAPLENLDFITNNGSFTVDGDPPPPTDGVTLTIPDVCYNTTANFCIPVTVEDFTNISQLDFSLAWDPSVISLTGVGDSPLSGFNPSSQVFTGNSMNGILTFAWFDGTAVNPNTFPDGSPIVEFCFEVVGALGDVSPVTLEDMPTDIVVGQAGATPADPVTNLGVTLENGSVTVKLPQEGFFEVATSCPTTDASGLACVDFIVVEGFEDLVITEWSWRWDVADLNFVEVRNLHPNAVAGGLSDIDFGLGFLADGRMNIAWTNMTTPVSIPDGATYFSACYQVLKECPADDGSTIDIEIFESQVPNIPFVVTDDPSAQSLLDYDFSGCTITVDCGDLGAPPMLEGSATLGAPSACANTGRISQAFSGGTAPYSIQWSGGNAPTNPTTINNGPAEISNLAAGTYSLTITDVNNASVTAGPWTLSAPNPLTINPTIIPVDCNSLGSITINATGGTPPYSYIGPNGNMQTHSGLGEGSYRIEVRDADGCAEVLFVNVMDVCPAAELECNVEKLSDAMCGRGGRLVTSWTGGTGNVLVSFNPAIQDLSNVAPNTYSVTFVDQQGVECVEVVTVSEVAETPININVTDIEGALCNGQGGSADINITGGCEPVNCRLQLLVNGQPSTPLNCAASGNLNAGEYIVTAISNIGTEEVEFFTIPDPIPDMPLSCSAEQVQAGGPCFNQNGSLIIQAEGGCGAYRATILPQGSTNTPQNVNLNTNIPRPPGNYDVVVTDASGNTCVDVVTIEGSTVPLLVEISSDTCMLCATPSGGIGSYEFEWVFVDTGGNQNIVSTDACVTLEQDSLAVNQIYTVIVTDGGGCSVTDNAAMICPADTTGGGMDTTCVGLGPVIFSDVQGSMAACAGMSDCNGTVSGVISQECYEELGGTGYSIVATSSVGSNTEVLIAGPGPFSIGGLCAEEYSILVEDPDGNTFSAGVNLTVTAPEAIEITMVNRVCSEVTMEGIDNMTGSLEVTVEGGTTPYSIEWTDINDNVLDCEFGCDDLGVGTYFIKVIDSLGCEQTDFIEIEQCVIETFGDNCIGTPVITPNGDGMNDLFDLHQDCFPAGVDNELNVYDRWGRLVHNSQGYQNDWGGTGIDGEELIEGAYYWVFIMDDGVNPKTIVKGTVTLLRNRP